MKFWLDAQLPPALCPWIKEEFSVEAAPVREMGLRESSDEQIFEEAKKAIAIVITKDKDFVLLLERFGPPPQILLLTCGNTSTTRLKEIFSSQLRNARRDRRHFVTTPQAIRSR